MHLKKGIRFFPLSDFSVSAFEFSLADNYGIIPELFVSFATYFEAAILFDGRLFIRKWSK